MEHSAKDFGTGLLEYVRRSPVWDPHRRALVRVPYATLPPPEPRRRRALTLVPSVAALFAGPAA